VVQFSFILKKNLAKLKGRSSGAAKMSGAFIIRVKEKLGKVRRLQQWCQVV
jgi:hypothetical protein